MKTYDTGAATHGTRPFFQSLKGIVKRFFDRERELISLRNAVGMMSEARRGDAREYHEMREALIGIKSRQASVADRMNQIVTGRITDGSDADNLYQCRKIAAGVYCDLTGEKFDEAAIDV